MTTGDEKSASDADLLQRFIANRDPAAMTGIIERHGPLVMGLCRGILRNEQDAADAFQTTFLVLLKNAASIDKPASLPSWLHGVACRVAVRSRSQSRKRRQHESSGATMPTENPTPSDRAADAETLELLHQELSRLPEQLRLPLILCSLQGRSREQAAEQLGWTLRSVKDRLERARALLIARLTRRGVALPAAAISALLTQQGTAAVPAAMASSTVNALVLVATGKSPVGGVVSAKVASLTKGVLFSMNLAKLKTGALVVAALLLLGFSSLVIVGAVYGKLSSVIAASPPEWLRGSGDTLEMRLAGGVLDANGSPARDFQVSAVVAQLPPYEAAINGDRFEVWIPVNRNDLRALMLNASTKENDHLACRTLNGNELRQAAIDGLTLTLEPPARRIQVKVVFDGRPVAGASVLAGLGWQTQKSQTNSDGIARIGLLPQQELHALTAWTDDFRIGGFSFDRGPPRDPLADEHTIELSACHDQKVRLVQSDGTPVARLDFVMQIATPPPNYNFLGGADEFRMTTDAAGETTYRWFPNWEGHYYYADLRSPEWVTDGEHTRVDDVVVFPVKRRSERKLVTGSVDDLAGAGTPGGFYVELQSFQGEREHRGDSVRAFTDADGSFSVAVFPNSKYCASVLDSRWVSPAVDLIPYESATNRLTPPALTVSEGQEVEVIVTTGTNRRPFPNLRVNLRRPYSYSWQENGETSSGSGGPSWSAMTDASGRITLRALPGELEVSVHTPSWRAQELITVEAGKTATVNIHRAVETPRTVSGRLRFAEGVAGDLRDIQVKAGAIDGNTDDQRTLSANADGTFSCELLTSAVAVFARTRDGRYAGWAVARNTESPLDVTLHPTLDYHGRLLGDDDRPIADQTVLAVVRVGLDDNERAAFPKSIEGLRVKAKTDDEGNYVLPGLPAQTKISVSSSMPDHPEDERHLDDIFLNPGESRPVAISRLTTRAAQQKSTLPERYQRILRDCALCDFRLMLILPASGKEVDEFVDRHFMDYDTNRAVPSFMQLVMTPAEIGSDASAAGFLAERSWQTPADGHVAAFAVDLQGRELARIDLAIGDPTSVVAAAEFVRKNALAPVDAAKKWNAAFAEAERTNRRVWARISQRYCGPCFMLARWLDDQRELIEKDYVLLKIDDVRDEHGSEVAGRLTRSVSHGVPFHAIFDSTGTLLIDSAGPVGNIGHPSGFEGQKQLRKMLLQTRRSLTDAEIEQIVESVGN